MYDQGGLGPRRSTTREYDQGRRDGTKTGSKLPSEALATKPRLEGGFLTGLLQRHLQHQMSYGSGSNIQPPPASCQLPMEHFSQLSILHPHPQRYGAKGSQQGAVIESIRNATVVKLWSHEPCVFSDHGCRMRPLLHLSLTRAAASDERQDEPRDQGRQEKAGRQGQRI